MAAVVTDNRDRNRFEIEVDGEVAGFADYRRSDGVISFVHAEVDQDREGEGLGSTLAAESLDAAREAGLAVLPACPFYASWIDSHRDYADLVPEDRREEFGL